MTFIDLRRQVLNTLYEKNAFDQSTSVTVAAVGLDGPPEHIKKMNFVIQELIDSELIIRKQRKLYLSVAGIYEIEEMKQESKHASDVHTRAAWTGNKIALFSALLAAYLTLMIFLPQRFESMTRDCISFTGFPFNQSIEFPCTLLIEDGKWSFWGTALSSVLFWAVMLGLLMLAIWWAVSRKLSKR